MLSQALLKSQLTYNPESGVFNWKKGKAGVPPESSAGYMCDRGYIKICINKRKYTAHRLAFVYMYGSCPSEIDHINGVKHDNRISNIRKVTHAENMKNQKMYASNKSGVTGVYWDGQHNKWRANIRFNGKCIPFGRFEYKWEAICRRKTAENKYGFHANHGRTA